MTYSEKMLAALRDQQLALAKQNFKLALENDDDDMLYSLAEELYNLGLSQDARQIYLNLLKKYPNEDELRTSLAELAINDGHNDEALAYLSQVQPGSNAYLQSLLVAADLYQTESEFEVTEAKLQEAARVAPDEPAVQFALGEFYYLTGRFEEAIQYYFALIKNGYTDFAKVDIAGRLGMAYAQAGQFKQALGYLKQVQPEYRSSDIRFQTALTELQLADFKSAIADFRELIREDPQYASAYPELANAYVKQQQYQQALTAAQEGLAVDQYNARLYAQAADITSHLGNQHLMNQYLAKANELAPDNLTITLQYSNFLLHQHNDQANIDLLLPLVKEDEVDPQVYWNLAKSYQRLEKFELADKYYNAALPTYRDDPAFLKNLIRFYQELGNNNELINYLHHYLELEPTDSEMQDLYNQYHDYL